MGVLDALDGVLTPGVDTMLAIVAVGAVGVIVAAVSAVSAATAARVEAVEAVAVAVASAVLIIAEAGVPEIGPILLGVLRADLSGVLRAEGVLEGVARARTTGDGSMTP